MKRGLALLAACGLAVTLWTVLPADGERPEESVQQRESGEESGQRKRDRLVDRATMKGGTRGG